MSTAPASRARLPSRRAPAFLAVSLALHLAALFALGVLGGGLWAPRLEVTWLDIDNRLGAPRPRETAAPERPAAPPAKGSAPKAKAKRPKPKLAAVIKPEKGESVAPLRPDAGPPSDAGSPGGGSPTHFATDQVALSDLAPGDAALVLLLRMDRIRKSPYESGVRHLLEVFYDHKTILWSSGLDPINDFETLLIATPNPYRVTETFLAARHTLPLPRVKRALQQSASFQRKRLQWVDQGGAVRGEIPSPPKLPGDPRAILLQPELLLLTDPRNLQLLSTLTTPVDAGPSSVDAGPASQSWISRLGSMGGRGGAGAGGPGMLLQAMNVSRLVLLPPDVPAPTNVQVTVEAIEPTRAEAVLTFGSPEVARAFMTALPQRIGQAKRSIVLRLLGVADLLGSIVFKRKEGTVSASVELTGDQVRALLEIMRRMIPQVRVPGMPDRSPPDARVSPSDAGPRAARPSRDAGPPPPAPLRDAGPDARGSVSR